MASPVTPELLVLVELPVFVVVVLSSLEQAAAITASPSMHTTAHLFRVLRMAATYGRWVTCEVGLGEREVNGNGTFASTSSSRGHESRPAPAAGASHSMASTSSLGTNGRS